MSELSIAKYFPFMRAKITGQSVHGENAASAMIQVAPDLRYRPLCHHCQSPAGTVHSAGYSRFIRDLNMAATEVWLQVEYRKVWCGNCGGVRVEHLSFADASRRVTDRLSRYIHDLCKSLTVQDVAEHLELDPKTVKAIDKPFIEERIGLTDGHDLRDLAIDESDIRKGHNYMTVGMDNFSGRGGWMGEGRSNETLDGFVAEMTAKQKMAIEAGDMDMWEPFSNRVKHH